MIRFAAIGLNHGHILGQIKTLSEAGGKFAGYYAAEPELIEWFRGSHPDVKLARSAQELLEDESIHVITTASIPAERSAVGITAMRHGKDVLSDKPACTTLEQLGELRKVQHETGRIYAVLYGERMQNPAAIKAGELVHSGAIGKVVQTQSCGPHRANLSKRAPWFFEREQYGGIINDIGSHQCEQFLYFSGSKNVEIIGAQVANVAHPQHPGLEDFGEAMLRGDGGANGCSGYIRVDWFTPDAMPAFGDARLTVVGTEGTIEVRKYCDLAGRSGGNHLFLVNHEKVEYIDCKDVVCPFGQQFVFDVLHRTETATPQEHYFAAAELALRAQTAATKFGHLC